MSKDLVAEKRIAFLQRALVERDAEYCTLRAERDRLREQAKLAMAEAQDVRERWIPECDRLTHEIERLTAEYADLEDRHCKEGIVKNELLATHAARIKELEHQIKMCMYASPSCSEAQWAALTAERDRLLEHGNLRQMQEIERLTAERDEALNGIGFRAIAAERDRLQAEVDMWAKSFALEVEQGNRLRAALERIAAVDGSYPGSIAREAFAGEKPK